MNRVFQLHTAAQASGEAIDSSRAVGRKTHAVANVIRVLGNAPAALRGFLSLKQALAAGVLSDQLREQVDLAVSDFKARSRRFTSSTLTGKSAAFADAESAAAHFSAMERKSEAVLNLVWALVIEKEPLDDADIRRARAAGLSDEEIVEVVANVALTILTNDMNLIARSVIDCPKSVPMSISDEALHSALFPHRAIQPYAARA